MPSATANSPMTKCSAKSMNRAKKKQVKCSNNNNHHHEDGGSESKQQQMGAKKPRNRAKSEKSNSINLPSGAIATILAVAAGLDSTDPTTKSSKCKQPNDSANNSHHQNNDESENKSKKRKRVRNNDKQKSSSSRKRRSSGSICNEKNKRIRNNKTNKNRSKSKKIDKDKTTKIGGENSTDEGSTTTAETVVKHPVPLASKRSQYVGPVVRINRSVTLNKNNNNRSTSSSTTAVSASTSQSAALPLFQYTVLNKFPARGDHDAKSRLSANQSSNQIAWTTRYKKTCDRLFGSVSECNVVEWQCALCHRKPWCSSLGDLYGPYYLDLPSPPPPPPPPATMMLPPPPLTSVGSMKTNVKQRKNNSHNRKSKNLKADPTPPPSLAPPPPPPMVIHEEVWLHEDCAVWCPGVIMIAGKLLNLEVAIIEAARMRCMRCSLPGATLACFERRCPLRALHYPCARELGFYFEEAKLAIYCAQHTPPPPLPPPPCTPATTGGVVDI